MSRWYGLGREREKKNLSVYTHVRTGVIVVKDRMFELKISVRTC